MRPHLLPLAAVCASMLLPALASADETMKPVVVYGRPARPAVVIEIKRETPNLGIRPIVPPKSFFSQESQ